MGGDGGTGRKATGEAGSTSRSLTWPGAPALLIVPHLPKSLGPATPPDAGPLLWGQPRQGLQISPAPAGSLGGTPGLEPGRQSVVWGITFCCCLHPRSANVTSCPLFVFSSTWTRSEEKGGPVQGGGTLWPWTLALRAHRRPHLHHQPCAFRRRTESRRRYCLSTET